MELIKKEATFNKPMARRGTQCHENVGVMEGFPEEMPNGLRAEVGGDNKAKKGGNSSLGSRNSMCKGPVVRSKKISVTEAYKVSKE